MSTKDKEKEKVVITTDMLEFILITKDPTHVTWMFAIYK